MGTRTSIIFGRINEKRLWNGSIRQFGICTSVQCILSRKMTSFCQFENIIVL